MFYHMLNRHVPLIYHELLLNVFLIYNLLKNLYHNAKKRIKKIHNIIYQISFLIIIENSFSKRLTGQVAFLSECITT